jgi:putative oxidoreductase
MSAEGLSPALLLLPGIIALELCGGLIVAVGRWDAVPTAFLLAIFTLATNFYFHDFWTIWGGTTRQEGRLFPK